MAQTKAQLKALRKKYHLGEFRKNKVRVRIKHTRRVKNMAKRKKSRKGGFSKGSNLMGTAVGVGGYILFEALIEPRIAGYLGGQGSLMLNGAELLLSVYLARKSGVVGSIGKAGVVLNTYQILQPLLANVAAGSSY